MNSNSYANIRTYHRDVLDIECRAFVLKTGIMARLWGANIHVYKNTIIKDNIIIAASCDCKDSDDFPVCSFEYISPKFKNGDKEIDILKEVGNIKESLSKIQGFIDRKQVLND